MKYYIATVVQEIEIPVGNKGNTKIKKLKEEILVGEATSVSVVENKVSEMMTANPNTWELTSVRESRIVDVIW